MVPHIRGPVAKDSFTDACGPDILQVSNLERHFGGVRAVNGVTFSVPRGAVIGLCGANGSGKTTTFNCITGVDRPSRGQIRFEGRDITGADPYYVFHLGIGRMFQLVRLFPALTVLENLVAVGAARRPDILDASLAVLSDVGLRHMADAPAASLSFGQKKLLELARVLLLKPKLLLMDEPAAGVNPALLDRLLCIIQSYHAAGGTILIVEHNMKVIATLCQQVLVLSQGAIIAQGTPQDVSTNPDVVQAYLGT